MWYTMETGLFISKDEAAIWAIELMPVELASVLLVAKKAYLTGVSVDWENQQVWKSPCVRTI
ncbi:DUF4111 domain-containing protein [Providencia rettgeri]|uniref:DUF4111 domain-containing protein n=1 Tax=Providencia rettgeri TaxID=587 RepID=A0A939NFM4_PRORE|nr:DUF4111 domain-containing protein [Providencia rettgeri]